MGDLWTPDIDDWLRAAGLQCGEWQGWLTRSRGSGGLDDIYAIQCHHDASSTSTTLEGASRHGYETVEFAPVGALRLDRGTSGRWNVGAAGATNTSGKGGPLVCSRGTIPLDSANRFVISIEALNNGVGELWSAQQRASYVRGVAAIIVGLRDQGAYDARAGAYRRIKLDPRHPGDVHSHFEYAPTRKIDPAGPPDPYGDLSDRYMRWLMNTFRADVTEVVDELSGGSDMGSMNAIRLRWAGYEDQLVGFHASGETLGMIGLRDDPVVVLPKPSPALKAKIEAELGHPLDPI